jgi:hypothetical protein
MYFASRREAVWVERMLARYASRREAVWKLKQRGCIEWRLFLPMLWVVEDNQK